MYRILPPPVQGDSLAIQEEENGAPRKPVSAPRPGWPEAGCFQRVKQHYQPSLLMLTEVTQSGKNEGSRVRLPWAPRQSGHIATSPSHRWLRTERVRGSRYSAVQGTRHGLRKATVTLLGSPRQPAPRQLVGLPLRACAHTQPAEAYLGDFYTDSRTLMGHTKRFLPK